MRGRIKLGRLRVRLLLLYVGLSTAPLVLVSSFVASGLAGGWIRIEASQRPNAMLFACVLLFGGLLSVSWLAWQLGQRVIEPLRKLRDSARQLGSGQLDRRLAVHTDDELAEAAASLNELADQISLVTGDLEGRVAERTRELGRAMGELHLLKRLNDAILHNIPNGIAILTVDGRLLYFNAGFQRTWSIDPACLGQPLRELGAGGPLGEVDWASETRPVAASSEPRRNVLVQLGHWPHRRVIQYSLFPLPVSHLEAPLKLVGEEFCLAVIAPPDCAQECADCFAHSRSWTGGHVLLLLDDITEQYQLEAQLIQSEKLAALGQLSAGVAHEIRNPLSAISGAAFYIGDVLTDDVPDLTDVEEYVRLIQRNVDRAQRIVTDILSFSRPSDAEGGVVDAAVLAEQTLAILDKAMVDQGIELRREITHGVMVQCRPETVKQALLNLIVNGMQAMPGGGVLTVGTVRSDGQPVLWVSDTGCGISAENLNHIFNPFFTTKPAGQGTGLGLSIARQAIENDKGRLEVESQVGQGTTFRICLPPAPARSTEPALAGDTDDEN